MGFTSGAKVLSDIIDEIADGLIASSSYWTDGDTTWDTSDRTGNNARRCLKYTGDSDDIWLSFEAINQPNGLYLGDSDYAKGLRFAFSASWDSVNHTYPDDTLENCFTFVQFEAESNHGTYADLSTLMLTYYLWIDFRQT